MEGSVHIFFCPVRCRCQRSDSDVDNNSDVEKAFLVFFCRTYSAPGKARASCFFLGFPSAGSGLGHPRLLHAGLSARSRKRHHPSILSTASTRSSVPRVHKVYDVHRGHRPRGDTILQRRPRKLTPPKAGIHKRGPKARLLIAWGDPPDRRLGGEPREQTMGKTVEVSLAAGGPGFRIQASASGRDRIAGWP